MNNVTANNNNTIAALDLNCNTLCLDDLVISVEQANYGVKLVLAGCKYSMSVIAGSIAHGEPNRPYEIAILDPVGGLLAEIPSDIALAALGYNANGDDGEGYDVMGYLNGDAVCKALIAMSKHTI